MMMMMMMMDDYDSTGWTKVEVVLDQTGVSE
jgi:hypothetical protein